MNEQNETTDYANLLNYRDANKWRLLLEYLEEEAMYSNRLHIRLKGHIVTIRPDKEDRFRLEIES